MMNAKSLLLNSVGPCLLLSLVAGCGGKLRDGVGGDGGSTGDGGSGASISDGGNGASTSNGGNGGTTSDGGNGGDGGSISNGGNGGIGGNGGDGGSIADGGGGATGDVTPPFVIFTVPTDQANGVVLNANVNATFNELMDDQTITEQSFLLMLGNVPVTGDVTYAGTVATFDPNVDLLSDSTYTATVTTTVTDLAGNEMVMAEVWMFQTGSNIAIGPAPVNLGTAGNFVILSKSGIATIPQSVITGHIGVSPIDSTAITGFSLMLDSTNTFATSTQVIGNVYASDYAAPTPSNLTVAINNMETAYTDAAGRPLPDFTELGAGDISGLTLVPGLYKWGTGLVMNTDFTLDGGPNDVWIFQIGGGITQASDVEMIMNGGANPANVFWQAAGTVALDTGAHLEGNILSQTQITLATGASVDGRLLAQTAVTLDAATVTQP